MQSKMQASSCFLFPYSEMQINELLKFEHVLWLRQIFSSPKFETGVSIKRMYLFIFYVF